MSLIAVSPRKVGVAFTGLDQSNFVSRPSTLALQYVRFLGDKFWCFGVSGSLSQIFHMYDPTAGLNGLVYSASNIGTSFYGMDWDGGSTIIHNSIDNGNSNINSAWYSADLGVSFTARPYNIGGWHRGVAFGVIADGTPVWLSCGNVIGGSSGAVLSRSTDGGWTWVNRSATTGWSGGCNEIAFNPAVKRFVAGSTNSTAVRWSADGLVWTTVTNINPGAGIRKIFCINNRFVILFNNPTIAFSDDGVSWSVYGFPTGVTTNNWGAACYANGLWIVTNGTNVIMYSTNNGVSWTPSSLPNNFVATQVAYGNGQILFTGSSATTYLTYAF